MRRFVPIALSTALVLGAMAVASPIAGATTKATPMTVAQAAVAEAKSEHRVVTGSDIAKATKGTDVRGVYGLYSYLGTEKKDVGYPRLELFAQGSSKNLDGVCITFPNAVGGSPSTSTCPKDFVTRAQVYIVAQTKQALANADGLAIAQDAVNIAATNGEAVGPSDVVSAIGDVPSGVTVKVLKNLKGVGSGGVIELRLTRSSYGTQTSCVSMPKSVNHNPYVVSC